MIHCGESPHPSHQGFADAIDADLYGLNTCSVDRVAGTIPVEVLNGLLMGEYDVCIAEGTRSLYGSLSHQLFSDSTLIYIAADQSLYQVRRHEDDQPFLNRLIGRYGMSAMETAFNRYIDGVIAVSEFTAEYTNEIVHAPTRIAHPYIQPDLYDELGTVTPDLASNTAVTVGGFAQYKGQDILVDAWRLVRDRFPGARLRLVGSGYPPELDQEPGVTVRGYVDDLCAEFERASLYVQPSRADSYPVSVLEALRAGLPTLVTTTTGNKTEAERVSSELVVEPSAERIADGVAGYFGRDVSERETMSATAERRGRRYDGKTQKEIFRRQFHELLSEIGH
ncbi:glycosyltransferase family 4 protein [Candidatus Halobonum tyrrellensis]|nr:glycosyltransferase family 4 protein [Candidatus Halobonum tyrrellensis]